MLALGACQTHSRRILLAALALVGTCKALLTAGEARLRSWLQHSVARIQAALQ